LEDKYRKAIDFLSHTGEGITSKDEKMGVTNIREKVLKVNPIVFGFKIV